MSTFRNKPLNQSKVVSLINRNHFLFIGLPLILSITIGSYGLSYLTQTRYDIQKMKTKKLEKEELLQINNNKKRFNLQEEYWNLLAEKDLDDWENKRLERQNGQFDGILR
ncbi:8912_t:CDS:2 [Entrophospora sp. SA101]|nr:1806_t:CDS:2 [Entrophospora sp. SA101]CAJ0843911.1 9690_t:CDS:2 [Entrophospora sp. SA101]CAJ0904489.1 8912_t:CDS:2 [Entrophospora sp. SA101]